MQLWAVLHYVKDSDWSIIMEFALVMLQGGIPHACLQPGVEGLTPFESQHVEHPSCSCSIYEVYDCAVVLDNEGLVVGLWLCAIL